MILVISMTSGVYAVEVNQRQGLAPEQRTKVNSALAKSYMSGATALGNDCGATQLGTVQPKTPTTKVENTFVARGDVIVVNRHVRCR
jgi:hypothetical protein